MRWGMRSIRSRCLGLAVPVLVSLVAVAGCGSSSTTSTSTSTSQATTSSTAPAPSVVVTPPQGPVGATFTLTAASFKPGESIRFEIATEKIKPFTGPPHKVGPDGKVTAAYQTTSTNPPGAYTVKATGDQGSAAQGQFTLAAASAPPQGTTSTTRKP